MASLADLQSVFQTTRPAGFSLADIEVQGKLAAGRAGVQRERVLRDHNRFALPDLLTSQAARGAFYSSATDRKRQQLSLGAGDRLADIQFDLAAQQAGLAANALLAKTGIRLGGV